MQSGSSKILKLMQRRYTRDHYQGRVEMIKRLMPDACIGADVIVGFPGETEEDFEETFEFIRSLDVSYLHVFTYSERPGTKAASMPLSIAVHERRGRNERLRILSHKKLRAFYDSQLGKRVDVVLEGRSINCEPEATSTSEGYTDNYVRVRFEQAISPEVTQVEALLGKIQDDIVTGQMIEVLSTRRAPHLELPILA
jgi:threonylcarbamoyladenosine tRNA methylthiotransferase MtaB